MKSRSVITILLLVVCGIIAARAVLAGCWECPLDSSCFTDNSKCQQEGTCTGRVVFHFDHWLCVEGGDKSTCYYYGDEYDCATWYPCFRNPDTLVCLMLSFPWNDYERQSTFCK